MRVLVRANVTMTILLAAFYVAWWWQEGMPSHTLAVTALSFAVAPLLVLLPGVWKAKRFATALAGMIVPFHFAYAVMELIANPEARGWIAVQTFLTLLLMTSLMASLRQVGERAVPVQDR